jgi:hypothetical protein
MKYLKGSQVSCNIRAFKEFVAPKPQLPATNAGSAGTTKKLEDNSKGTYAESKVKNLLGKTISFIIDGVANSTSKQEYLSGTPIESPDVEVRVFLPKSNPLWAELLSLAGDTVFEGCVQSVLNFTNQVTIHHTSIKESEEEEEEEIILGYGNRRLTEQQFLEKTNKGCAWCADPGGLSQAQTIHWISESEYVCEDCSEQDQVKEYLLG